MSKANRGIRLETPAQIRHTGDRRVQNRAGIAVRVVGENPCLPLVWGDLWSLFTCDPKNGKLFKDRRSPFNALLSRATLAIYPIS
jgi:hypothetical protein